MSSLYSNDTIRVILHLDLDAFYAQVESVRLGLNSNVPLAVQQWNGIIAVNYAARLWNITRSDRASDATHKCPFVHLEHVATIGIEPKTSKEPFDILTEEFKCDNTSSNVSGLPDRNKTKVTLERYRNASRAILQLLLRICGNERVEKASIDEAFIDVTDIVINILKATRDQGHNKWQSKFTSLQNNLHGEKIQKQLQNTIKDNLKASLESFAQTSGKSILQYGQEDENSPCNSKHDTLSKVPLLTFDEQVDDEMINILCEYATIKDWCFAEGTVEDNASNTCYFSPDWSSTQDISLFYGGLIASYLRMMIYKHLGYTSSVGVSHNKLLAKIGSARNKPFQQTLIFARFVPAILHDLPLSKLRLLGGKMGRTLRDTFNVETVGQAQRLSQRELEKCFGQETSQWMYKYLRGVDMSTITQRSLSKSLLAAKSFSATSKRETLIQWIKILVTELYPRIKNERDERQRAPTTLTLHYRCTKRIQRNWTGRSKCGPISAVTAHEPHALETKAIRLLDSIPTDQIYPCINLSIGVSSFVPVGLSGNMSQFLVKPSSNTTGVESSIQLPSSHTFMALDSKPSNGISQFLRKKSSSVTDGQSNVSTKSSLAEISRINKSNHPSTAVVSSASESVVDLCNTKDNSVFGKPTTDLAHSDLQQECPVCMQTFSNISTIELQLHVDTCLNSYHMNTVQNKRRRSQDIRSAFEASKT